MKIESLQNTQVKNWCKLKEKKYRDETNTFIVEGDHLIEEAKKNNVLLYSIGLDSSYDYEVNENILNKLSMQSSKTKCIGICRKQEEKEINGNVIILDDIQDPGNLGTIIRSAVAFKIDTVILSLNSVDLYNEKVIRATEGMIFNINVIRDDLTKRINELKNKNYDIYATTVNKTTDAFAKTNNIAIVIGNEGNGISKEIENLCNKNITIAMDERCESLNAGVCASILMYELMVK